MPPKKTDTKTKKSPPTHPAYKDMIKDAIIQLKERNGSSRQALKKYIKSNYNIAAPNFESLFNAAVRRGVTNGDFVQPKGPSGTVKLKKKEPAEKKAAPKKAAPKKAAPKKAAPKKAATTTKKAAPKKAAPKKAAPKKAAASTKSKVTKSTKAAPKKKTTKA